MYLVGILPSLALLCLIAGGRSETQCSFSIPALLKSGEMATGCLEVKRHSEPVNVDIILEVSGVNYTILSEQIPIGNTFKCPEFQVPDVTEASPVFLTINAVATNFNYMARRPVVVAPTGKVTLIQLEKSIYKPGQTVRLNVIALDNNLRPVTDTFPLIYVTDPSGNRLFQWNQIEVNYILALSFDLLSDPELGIYTVQIERGSRGLVSKSFAVDEYVLPNFEPKLSAPNSITILDKTLPYTVTAKYTYGQGVPGKVSGRVCRAPINYYSGNACNRNPDGLCIPITGVMDSNGTFSGELDMTTFQLDRSGYNMGLTMQITVIEEGSGIQATESKFISITSQLGRVYFNRENMEQFYKKGLPYYMEVTAVDGLENPLSNQTIELQVNGITVKNLTTDDNGKAKDYIDTSELEQSSVNIQVFYKKSEQCYDSNYIVPTYSNDYYSITRFYSRSGSFVHIDGPKEELQCGQTYNLTAKYIFSQSGLQEGETIAEFNYMVMSRTTIIESGTIPADLTNSLQGEFNILIEITPAHAPVIDIVVYYMLAKEVVTHTIHLNTEKCFSHQVSLQFSEERATPGSTVNMDITAGSRTICAVRIYDSSLALLQDQPLTPAAVYSSLQYISLNGYYVSGYNVAPPDPPCRNSDKQILFDGVYYSPVDFPNEGDSSQELSNVGMLLITNTTITKPTVCGRSPIFARPEVGFARPGFGGDFSASIFASSVEDLPRFSSSNVASVPISSAPEIQSVRKSFPEVLFFDHVNIGEIGSASVPLEVPGTITEWKGDMICLDHSTGFGMTKYPANLTAFQDIFVSEFLPYSFVRGEILYVRVVVSNYLNKCVKFNVQLESFTDYIVEPKDEDHDIKCVCFGERASYSFNMNTRVLGVVSVNITAETVHIGDTCEGPADPNEPSRRDTIIRSIIVEAEGIPKEVTKSTLVCVKDTSEVTPINISLPDNSVKDATRAKVTVIGDILGRALVNPESLINDPTGCGEQNLATLMPIALVMEYLNITGRLTEETKSRAVQFMGNGYRRQLRYRNSDGGFSAFGGGVSSSWLTIQTLATLQLVKRYTFVEDRILNQALVYLESLKDRTTGGFKPRGTLFNNALKGGAEDDVSFTAALAALLLQTEYVASPTLLREAMNFLDAASRREQSVYNVALLFYVFRVAGNEERSNAMFEKLDQLKIQEAGTTHWERPNKPNKQTSYVFSSQANSGEIEITSYVLLALTSGPIAPHADLGYLSQIALWLSQQQNAYGSYSTTADTVVALQALCGYGALVHQKDASNVVEVKYGDEVVKEFSLDSGNRTLLQTQPLSTIPGDYSVTVSGNGCVLVQATVDFNIPVDEEDSAFLLSVSSPSDSCVDGVAYTMPVSMNVSYHGLQNKSNMALIDLPLPSGYKMEYTSLMQLRNKVSKVEEKNNHVIIYLDSVSSDTLSLDLTLQMTTRVQNLQPKYVLVWDYYETGENGIAVLRHPCSAQ